jgi:hypothetical protein
MMGGLVIECVEFLDASTMKAINLGGLAGRQFPEKDTLFFKVQGWVIVEIINAGVGTYADHLALCLQIRRIYGRDLYEPESNHQEARRT